MTQEADIVQQITGVLRREGGPARLTNLERSWEMQLPTGSALSRR